MWRNAIVDLANRRPYNSACLTNIQRRVTLLIADRLFQGKDNQALAQSCDQNRRPIWMITDLDRDNAMLGEDVDLRLEVPRALFNITKCPQEFAVRRENRGRIAFLRKRLAPRHEQWVARLHRLRKIIRAITFRARFRT
jgi:hypothetical protein